MERLVFISSTSSTPSSVTPTSSTTNVPQVVLSPTMRRFQQYKVKPEQLTCGEYEYRLKFQHGIGLKKTRNSTFSQIQEYNQYISELDTLDELATALTCTSGGIVRINSNVPISKLDFDQWCLTQKDRFKQYMSDKVYPACIDLQYDAGCIIVLLKKAPEFVTTRTHLTTRGIGHSEKVRHAAGVQRLLSQTVKHSYTIALQNSYNYGDVFPYSEGKHIEFKCFKSAKSANDILEELTKERNSGLFFGFGNTGGGGYAILGIDEDRNTGNTVVEGQCLPPNDHELFQMELNRYLTKDSQGNSRIWGKERYTPWLKRDWDIAFIPVHNGPEPNSLFLDCSHQCRFVIVILIHQCDGGVFAKRPESYMIDDNGDIDQVSFENWRNQQSASRRLYKRTILHEPSLLPCTSTSQQPASRRQYNQPASQSILPQPASQLIFPRLDTWSSQDPYEFTADGVSVKMHSKDWKTHTGEEVDIPEQLDASPFEMFQMKRTNQHAPSLLPCTSTSQQPASRRLYNQSASQSVFPQPASQFIFPRLDTRLNTLSSHDPYEYTADGVSVKMHSKDWKTHTGEEVEIPEELDASQFEMFQMKQPIHFTPSRNTLMKTNMLLGRVCDSLEAYMGEAFAITSPNIFKCFNCEITIPQSPHHVMDIFTMNAAGKTRLCSVCAKAESPIDELAQVTSARILARIIKKGILQIMSNREDLHIVDIHIPVMIYRFDGTDYYEPSPNIVEEAFISDAYDVDMIKSGIARLLLRNKEGSLFDAVGKEFTLHYSPHQIAATLSCWGYPISIITGAPGTGKSLVIQELCRMNGKNKSLYFCLTHALAQRAGYKNKIDALYVETCQDIVDHLGDQRYKDRTFIAIDDAQTLSWTESSLSTLCELLTGKCLTVALDSMFHNYKDHDQGEKLIGFLVAKSRELYLTEPYQQTLLRIFRNSEVVTCYMRLGFKEPMKQKRMESHALVEGDDVNVISVDNFHYMDTRNGVLRRVQYLCNDYKPRHIAVLIYRGTHSEVTAKIILKLFDKYLHHTNPHEATYPATGVTISSLDNFMGMDSQVVVCPVWKGSENILSNAKFRCAVSSRAIRRIEFLQPDLDHKQAEVHGLDQVPTGYKKGYT